jgi:hypothetical protein
VIIDGHVERLDSGAWIALRAITRSPRAGTLKAAQFLDVEVEQLAGSSTLVAHDRRFGRFQGREPVEAVAAEHTRERGFRNRRDHQDLRIGAPLPAQSDYLGFQLGVGLLGLAQRSGRTVMEASRKALFLGTLEPGANRLSETE